MQWQTKSFHTDLMVHSQVYHWLIEERWFSLPNHLLETEGPFKKKVYELMMACFIICWIDNEGISLFNC